MNISLIQNAENFFKQGNAFIEKGRREEALQCYEKALNINPKNAEVLLNKGNVLLELGRQEDAKFCYFKVIEINPANANAYNNLGVLLEDQGNKDDAITFYRKAIELIPQFEDACMNLGTALHLAGQMEEAISWLKKTINLNPEKAMAHFKLGNIFNDLKNYDEALLAYEKAASLKPDFADAYYCMGNVLSNIGQLDKAETSYLKALNAESNDKMIFPKILNNLGIVFKQSGRDEEAIKCFSDALLLNPNHIDSIFNTASILQEKNKDDEAIEKFQYILKADPKYSQAHVAMGNIYGDHGKIEEAEKHYQKAIAIKNDFGIRVKEAFLMPVIIESAEQIKKHRKKIVEFIEANKHNPPQLRDPFEQVRITNFYLAYHHENDREINKKLATFYASVCPKLLYQSPHVRRKVRHEKIHIGFVSNYLHSHTIGNLNYGLIRHLPKERYFITVFHTSRKNDKVRQSINQAADKVVYLPPNLFQSQKIVSQNEPDILYYTDIGMDSLTYFLAFSRLARIQCATWGHPVTTGLPEMDYFISSKHLETPESKDHYSEKLITLDPLNTYYYKPEKPTDTSRNRFGFSSDEHLYVCPQSLFKFHPDFDPMIRDILLKDSKGVLVLIQGKYSNWTDMLKQRILKNMPDVSLIKERIKFVPSMSRPDFLSLLSVADVVLDTPYFSGGNSSLETFAMGTPVVTLEGPYMRERITLACYKQMGFDDCIARNASTYINIALKLANDKSWNNAIREKISACSYVLFENKKVIAETDEFFQKVLK